MTKITFTHDSIIKHRPILSDDLINSEKQIVKKGDKVYAVAISPEIERGHLFITLDQSSTTSDIKGRNSVYLYLPHTDYQPEDVTDPNIRASAATYHIDDEGIKLIKHYEGLRLREYKCSSGIATLGLGSTTWFDGSPIYRGQTCTENEAVERFKQDIVRFENGVIQGVTVPITQGEFSSLVSFAYNCGTNAFLKSTLLRKLNAGDFVGAAFEFSRWTNGALPGLVSRRQSEIDLFRNGKFVSHN